MAAISRHPPRREPIGPATAWAAFKRLTQLSFPRRFPIVQFPNAPLIVAFAAGEIAKHAQGSIHAYGASVSYVAMGVWAYLELTAGVNWFRRLLGAAYAVSTVVHLALALHG